MQATTEKPTTRPPRVRTYYARMNKCALGFRRKKQRDSFVEEFAHRGAEALTAADVRSVWGYYPENDADIMRKLHNEGVPCTSVYFKESL